MTESLLSMILVGIMLAESGGDPKAIGDDGISIGAYQLNERYHIERAAKWGEYDPFDPEQARHIAAHIIEENYQAFSYIQDNDLRVVFTIASYRQGVAGVKRNGPTVWYVDRVRKYGGFF